MGESGMLGGIFVGGSASRMGGIPKGLLAIGGVPIVVRLRQVLEEAGVEPVLVGANSAYSGLSLAQVNDAPPGVGPIGGLAALLRLAAQREGDPEARAVGTRGRFGGACVLSVACDMPRVSAELVRRLVEAAPAPAVAAKRGGRWEPMLARFDVAAALPVVEASLVARRHGLQALLDELGAVPLALTPDEERLLDDWDTPEDVRGD
jgi:molybdopterin-guanine dinucleotide biosynthesis protein A